MPPFLNKDRRGVINVSPRPLGIICRWAQFMCVWWSRLPLRTCPLWHLVRLQCA